MFHVEHASRFWRVRIFPDAFPIDLREHFEHS